LACKDRASQKELKYILMAKILIFSTDWGHGSIAKAVKESVEKEHATTLHIIPAEKASKISYEFVYKFVPGVFRLAYWLSKFNLPRQFFNLYSSKSYEEKLKEEILRVKPEVVINTYFAFNHSLEKLMDRFNFKFINVFADPWTFGRV
jgi:hypothetical protein